MASSYSSLGVELMATGENSGTWGDKTNTNLNIMQQIASGYIAKSIAGGVQTTALTVTNGNTGSEVATQIIELTGTITGNQIVTIPDSVEMRYIVKNSTSGAFTVQFKTASGTGTTFATTDKSHKFLYSNGTNIIDVMGDSSDIQLATQNLLKFGDADDSHFVALKAPATVGSSLTLTLPSADGSANQALVTNGAGVLSFAQAGITTGKAIAMALVFG
jgi:hypothetical protein|tara:strand:+ start:351 stop:1004 length:654 start_codon:yes stop_codon:yes gene_type:complete